MTQTTANLLDELNAFAEQFRTMALSKLKEYFVEFWKKNPAIKAVIWVQYAPYFNDGEPCEFCVHEPYFTNAEGEDLDDITSYGEYEGEKEGIWSDYMFGGLYRDPAPEGVDEDSTNQLSSLLCSNVMENTMKATFGPDNRVVATREGFQISDYSGSHD